MSHVTFEDHDEFEVILFSFFVARDVRVRHGQRGEGGRGRRLRVASPRHQRQQRPKKHHQKKVSLQLMFKLIDEKC